MESKGCEDALSATRQELLAWAAPVFHYRRTRTLSSQLILPRGGASRIVQSKDFLARQVEHLYYVTDVESPMFYA